MAALIATAGRPKGLVAGLALAAAVAICWLRLTPSNNGSWQPDVARLAWAEVEADQVTIHNVRNCDYRTETDYTPRWETKVVAVHEIDGIDLFLVHWGCPG